MSDLFSMLLRAAVERRILLSNAQEIGAWQHATRLHRYYAIAELSDKKASLLADPNLPPNQPLLFTTGEQALAFAQEHQLSASVLVMLSMDRSGQLSTVYAHHLTDHDNAPVQNLHQWFTLFEVSPNMILPLQVHRTSALAKAS